MKEMKSLSPSECLDQHASGPSLFSFEMGSRSESSYRVTPLILEGLVLQLKKRNDSLCFVASPVEAPLRPIVPLIFSSPVVAMRSGWSCCCCAARRHWRPSASQAPLHIILSSHFLLAAPSLTVTAAAAAIAAGKNCCRRHLETSHT